MRKGPGKWQRRLLDGLKTKEWVWVQEVLPKNHTRGEYLAALRAARTLPKDQAQFHEFVLGRPRAIVTRPSIDPRKARTPEAGGFMLRTRTVQPPDENPVGGEAISVDPLPSRRGKEAVMREKTLPHHAGLVEHGHASEWLRTAFQSLLDEYWNREAPLPQSFEVEGETVPVRWLLGRLWSCTDPLPREYAEMLELRFSQTYAAAMRRVRDELPGNPRKTHFSKEEPSDV